MGLEFQSYEPDSLKSAPVDAFSDFEHNYAHTDLNFYREGASYTFSTGSIGQGLATYMSVGTYQFNGWGGYASPSGTPELSFSIPDQDVVVETGSTSIDLEADVDCSLILIAVIHNQIESAVISGGAGYPVAFFQVGIYRYVYVAPESPYQAHIIKKNGAELVIDLKDLNTGTTYKIEITMD